MSLPGRPQTLTDGSSALKLDPQYQMRGLYIPEKKRWIREDNVVWMPQSKQTAFMRRPEYEVLYGGAAGGGKSDALLMEALRQVEKRKYKALILRKTFPELEEVIVRSQDLYPRIIPGAKYNDNKHVWIFPSGARIYFGSMQHTKDRKRYQGQQYAFIGFDELTHFTYGEYSYMFSRNRSADPTIRCYIRSTTNPGGVGHGWVKERFIANKIPMLTYVSIITVNGVEYRKTKTFVPATVYDNQALVTANPDYIASLAMLPEAELKALLGGDWDSFQGQAFGEFKDDSTHYEDRKWTHVITPFEIPETWKVYRSFDFGYSKPFSCAWWAIDHDGRMYRILELYGCTEQPNTGVKWEPNKIFREIREVETTHRWLKGKHISGIADPAIWDESGGESIHATAEKHRVYFDKGDNKRLPGKMQLHYRLAFDDNGIPMLYSFSTCKAFNRTIPSLVYSETMVEDIDTDGEDHTYDEARYLCMANPLAPRVNKAQSRPKDDPLNQHAQTYKPYGFMRA
jgi:hypothetical protein